MRNINVGFIGAGGIARAHVYAIESLKFYYDEVPEIILQSVTSARKESREGFAAKYGFRQAQSMDDFAANDLINAVFILGPNKVHFEHFELALQMQGVKYIYLEKPVCSSLDEEQKMSRLLEKAGKEIKHKVVWFLK